MTTLITGIGLIGSYLINYFDPENTIKVDIKPALSNVKYRDIRKFWTNEPIDRIYHLACPASPIEYQKDPLFTISTIVDGTRKMLDLAYYNNARIIIASTSEIYGDPLEHPQKEEYNGNVRTMSKRACYDEAKRLSETLAFEYQRKGVDVRIARIFNTYGISPHGNDGRLVSMLIDSTKNKKPFVIFGDGTQTRSMCWVEDTCKGLMTLMESDETRPVNIGNPHELSVNEIVKVWQDVHQVDLPVEYRELPDADPCRRCPDIGRAMSLGWEPETSIEEGFRKCL